MTEIVLLPGWGFSVAVLSPLATRLRAAGFTVTAIGLPPAATIDALAAALLAVAPPRAAWIGWSLGGMAAVAAARRAPGQVAGVVALGSNPSFVQRPGWPRAMPPADFADFSARVDADADAALARFAQLASRGGDAPREDARWLSGCRATFPANETAATLRDHLAILRDADLRAALPLPVPALWLLGENDALVPAAVAAGIAAHDNRARVAVLPGESHASFLRRPERLSPFLDAFLREPA